MCALCDRLSQVFQNRLDPVNVSLSVELGAVAMVKDTLQSTATETVGKDVTEHIALSYLPAKTPALEATVCEVNTGCKPLQ